MGPCGLEFSPPKGIPPLTPGGPNTVSEVEPGSGVRLGGQTAGNKLAEQLFFLIFIINITIHFLICNSGAMRVSHFTGLLLRVAVWSGGKCEKGVIKHCIISGTE